MTMPRKEKKRESRRAEKAEKAAILEKSIEKELLERLQKGVYGDIYNYPSKQYEKVLELEKNKVAIEEENEEEAEPEIEYVEGYDGLEEEDDMEDFEDFLKDADYGNTGEDEEGASEQPTKRKQKISETGSEMLDGDIPVSKSKKKSRVLIEVERDEDTIERQKAYV